MKPYHNETKTHRVIRFEETVTILARQGSMLASTFHPELSGDVRFHKYFLKNLIKK
ncbi:MAG: hypothetical protein J7J20_04710 [Desulfurococcales archaeon]|nr:hypothetical protein [Desulfurococcales archaeon]